MGKLLHRRCHILSIGPIDVARLWKLGTKYFGIYANAMQILLHNRFVLFMHSQAGRLFWVDFAQINNI